MRRHPSRPGGFRAGTAAIVGRPNVGKSTLLNQILGQKVAIISKTPQTTRTRILGVHTLPDAQLVLLDTPGIHKPLHHLNHRMVTTALNALREADTVLWLVEADAPPGGGDRYIMGVIAEAGRPMTLAVNKIDRVNKDQLLPLLEAWASMVSAEDIVPISARTGENVRHLCDVLITHLPEGPPLYAEEMVTDQTLRVLAAEIIREKILWKTREEVPYSVAVLIEEFREDPPPIMIRAVILVDKESQKGILIGKGGRLVRAIGQEARLELEVLLEGRLYLDLTVKLKKDWRESHRILQELGY